jgi:hypothetical protein
MPTKCAHCTSETPVCTLLWVIEKLVSVLLIIKSLMLIFGEGFRDGLLFRRFKILDESTT